MAVALPTIYYCRLIERGYVKTVKSAEEVVDRRDAVVWGSSAKM